MQDHGNADPPPRPSPLSPEYTAQKMVLGQLVVDPPNTGDRVLDLPRILDLPRAHVEAAIVSLVRAGLAERHTETVHATAAALYFEYLWPVML
jgi:predicted transcriptional regulator